MLPRWQLYCYLGKRHLDVALAKFPHRDEVVVEFRSFELDSAKPIYAGQNVSEQLAQQLGIGVDKVRHANEKLRMSAMNDGLDLNIEAVKPTNTLDAHRLAKFAQSVGKGKELIDAVFLAYFTESKLISDHQVLVDIAASIGLDRVQVMSVLQDPARFLDAVRDDESKAYQVYFEVVPHFLINNTHSISATPPVEVFIETLHKAWSEDPVFIDHHDTSRDLSASLASRA